MSTVKEMKATARARSGKGAARAERRAGRVPGVIYGDSKPPTSISLDYAELKQRIFAGHFLTSIYELDVDGTKHRVIPRDFQMDPVRDVPVHVDFLRLGVGAKIRVSIPIHVVNAEISPGVKRGGTVNVVTHAVPVEVPAENIPNAFEVDVSALEIAHSMHLSDVKLPPNVKVLSGRDLTLVTIVPPSGFLEEQRTAKEAAAAAATAAATAAAAPAGGTGAPGAAAAGGGDKKAPAGDKK